MQVDPEFVIFLLDCHDLCNIQHFNSEARPECAVALSNLSYLHTLNRPDSHVVVNLVIPDLPKSIINIEIN